MYLNEDCNKSYVFRRIALMFKCYIYPENQNPPLESVHIMKLIFQIVSYWEK